MRVELLSEPKLEFGNDFICDDPKKGILIGGFFSTTNNTHNSEIQYSIIGTKNNIQDTQDWIKSLTDYIPVTANEVLKNEASIEDGEIIDEGNEDLTLFDPFEFEETDPSPNEEESPTINKKLNPDFPDISKESPLGCYLLNIESANQSIKKEDIDRILKEKGTRLEKAEAIILLYRRAFETLLESPDRPKICILVIPSNVFNKLSSIPFGLMKVNFRRKIKAELLACGGEIPVQIILEDTLKSTKSSMQDKSMIAWNFSVAQYFKTNSTPWTISEIDPHACFIGVSFHKIINEENNILRSSVAQAFNREGKGLVFVGKQFEWDQAKTQVSAPHLTYQYAKDLMQSVISSYIQQNRKVKPNRVVVHKTTDYWNSKKHKDYAEVEGLKDGIREILGADVEIDLVTIKNSKIKLLRTDARRYPVIRGTLLQLNEYEGVLYPTGYIPYYETFPGMHMPLPKLIVISEGETTLRNVCEEIMALTKLNFNNCNYYDSLPITLRFAKKVGEIIQYLPKGIVPPNKYYYYM